MTRADGERAQTRLFGRRRAAERLAERAPLDELPYWPGSRFDGLPWPSVRLLYLPAFW
jgi:hypothetical protein